MPGKPHVRNREWERQATRHIAGVTGVDVEALNIMAEHRADLAQMEYGHDFPSLERNMEHETLEELADARNYVVWRMEAIHRGLQDADDRVEHLQAGLRYIALAFEEIRAAAG